MQLPPVEALKKKINAVLSSHCILCMFLGHHLGNLRQVWKMHLEIIHRAVPQLATGTGGTMLEEVRMPRMRLIASAKGLLLE